VGRYQKGKTNLDFTEARDSEWQWHQLGHMQVCTSLQTDNHARTSSLSFLQAGCPSCRPTNSVKALKAQQTVTGNSKCLKNNSVTEVMLTWTQNRRSQRQREWHRKQECQRLLNWTPLEQHTVAAFIYISINGATTDDWQSLTCRNKK